MSEFELAGKAFDTYIDLVAKGKARVEKSGETELGLDDDNTVLRTTAMGIQMLCVYGQRKEVERAQDICAQLESWMEKAKPDSSDPVVSADDVPDDLVEQRDGQHQQLSRQAMAVAQRGLGISRMQWAILTYDTPARPELHAKAIASFRSALDSGLDDEENGQTLRYLAYSLAQNRELEAAITSVKKAISLFTDKSEGELLEDSVISGNSMPTRHRNLLLKCWHLLALLLSARHEFSTAIASCEAAEDMYDAFSETSDWEAMRSLSMFERENILELEMSRISLSEVLDGPEEAVNGGGELLGLYARLFDYDHSETPKKAAPIQSSVETISLKQTANGTLRSFRKSILGRPKVPAMTDSKDVLSAKLASDPQEKPNNPARIPAISVADDEVVSEKPYQPPPHLARQESRKLHKRNSRRSIASDRKNRGASPNKRSIANGTEQFEHGLPLHVSQMRGSSSDTDASPSIGYKDYSSDEVGVAVTHDGPRASLSQQDQTHQPKSRTTHPQKRNISPHFPKPPLSQQYSKPSPISSQASNSLPDPIFSSTEIKRHALTLLTRIWLQIARLYRHATMPVDAQGALSEASKNVRSIQATVAAQKCSAEAFSTAGRGGMKSVAELWADVLAEQAAVHLELGDRDKASEEFEKALDWFPDHNAATVGLSNILLDFYTQNESIPLQSSSESSKSEPILATLPAAGVSRTGMDESGSMESEQSTTSLSRLVARDRAYGLLSMLTKSGRGWDDSEAWFALARAYEEGDQIEKAKEALWWVVELEESKPVREWTCVGRSL